MAWKKSVIQRILPQQTELTACFGRRNASERNSELSLLRNGLEQNSERLLIFLFHGTEFQFVSLPRNGSERNSERLLLILFHGTEFRAFSPLQNGSERNSDNFLFRGTAGIPPEQTNCSVYSVFRGIIFLSENALYTSTQRLFIILLDSLLYLIYFSNHSFTHFPNFMVSDLKTIFVSFTLFTFVVEMPMCPKPSSENLKSIIWVTRERHCIGSIERYR